MKQSWYIEPDLSLLLSSSLLAFYGCCYFLGFAMWLYQGLIVQCAARFKVMIGLSWRFLDKKQSIMRYVSGASYWIYLIQMPIIVLLVPILNTFNLSFYARFVLGVCACLGLCTGSYHFLIQGTWLRWVVGASTEKKME